MHRPKLRPLLPALFLLWPVLAAPAGAAEPPVFSLTLKDHRFTPAGLTVPAGQRFLIELTNAEDAIAEFESSDMRFEKIVVAGGKVTVRAGPLHPGRYKFFNEYHPEATGTVTATEAK